MHVCTLLYILHTYTLYIHKSHRVRTSRGREAVQCKLGCHTLGRSMIGINDLAGGFCVWHVMCPGRYSVEVDGES